MRITPFTALACISLFVAYGAAADYDWQAKVFRVVASPTANAIALRWLPGPEKSGNQIVVRRKSRDKTKWGEPLATLPADATEFVDRATRAGETYEYRLEVTGGAVSYFGYIFTGYDVPEVESRGKIIVAVDNVLAPAIAGDLAQLRRDLIGDGWQVVEVRIPRPVGDERTRNEKAAPEARAVIQEAWRRDPVNTKALYLVGHAPFARSGNTPYDGHYTWAGGEAAMDGRGHAGAWATDQFYADPVGEWTDTATRSTQPDPSTGKVVTVSEWFNENEPGDGRFDQNVAPRPVALMTGRADFYSLPRYEELQQADEVALLRRYLQKTHAYKIGDYVLPDRAIEKGLNALVRTYPGYAAFPSLVGPTQVHHFIVGDGSKATRPEYDFAATDLLAREGYKLLIGTNTGHWQHNRDLMRASGVQAGNIQLELAAYADFKVGFVWLHGSKFGDFGAEPEKAQERNNLLRSVIAARGGGLTAMWGRPPTFLHHFGLGEPIGFSVKTSQNNDGQLYRTADNEGATPQTTLYYRGIHLALMGDPTLRLHVVPPATSLRVVRDSSGNHLYWTLSRDATVIGYNVYRARSLESPFEKLAARINGTAYVDREGPEASVYMVRAVRREVVPSGIYFNLSIGAFASASETP